MVDPTTSSSSCVVYYESSTSGKKCDFTAMNSGKKEGGCGSDSQFQKFYPEVSTSLSLSLLLAYYRMHYNEVWRTT